MIKGINKTDAAVSNNASKRADVAQQRTALGEDTHMLRHNRTSVRHVNYLPKTGKCQCEYAYVSI